jgi:ligand-binding SRPBCC domain-containing protein
MRGLDAAAPSVLECSCEIAAPIAEVFAFHLDTRNAARIAPRGQRIVAVEGTFPLRLGSEARLRVRQLPLPYAQTWLVRVAALERPVLIIDELLQGPFPLWRHEHRFEELAGGRTRLTDRVTYRLPAGPLGRLAGAVIVHRSLRASFRRRQARTRELLEAAVRR